jgi:preprotein translocase SecE subunit
MLGMFGCWRLYYSIARVTLTPTGKPASFGLFHMQLPVAACWAAAVFIILALLCSVLFAGVEVKLGFLSRVSHNLIDHLIDTQAELGKVAWPGKDQVVSSTTAVLVSVALLTTFLLGMDYVLGLLAKLVFAK